MGKDCGTGGAVESILVNQLNRIFYHVRELDDWGRNFVVVVKRGDGIAGRLITVSHVRMKPHISTIHGFKAKQRVLTSVGSTEEITCASTDLEHRKSPTIWAAGHQT